MERKSNSSKLFALSQNDDGEFMSKLKDIISVDPNVTTFMHDENLPNLPVPPLDQTMERYLRSCSPLLEKEELEATEKLVRDFLTGDGPVLQAKLEQKAAQHKNWLEDWWLEHAYLNYREPLIPFLNIGGPQTLHLSKWPPAHRHAITYASMFTYSALLFCQLLREEVLQPQTSVKGGRLSMEQFRRLFNTCRIPAPSTDVMKSWWKTKREGDCPDHLIVLCNGHIWYFRPYDSRGGIMTVLELEAQFREIRDQSDSMGQGPAVASLTAESRDVWAKNHEWLKALSASNAKTLELIESAAFVVVLDNSEASSMPEVFWDSVCGDTSNRWADKSFSIVVTRSGYALSNNDHTPYDAMVLVVLMHFGHRLNDLVDVRALGGPGVRSFQSPKLLKFDLDPSIISAISSAQEKSKKLTGNVNISFKQYLEFGKNWMKEKKVHPDALVQVTLQLAYYRAYGRMAPTYETATTRQFYHGRTETVKSCTPAAKTFAVTMQDPSASVGEKVKALRAACESHDALMRQCQSAQGVDRHLFGLYLTAVETGHDVPAIFTDPGFAKAGGGGNYVLSTSTLGYTDCTGGVAPMVPHGYGVFYTMMPEWMYIMVSSFKDGGSIPAPDFLATFTGCLDDVKAILDDPSSSSKL